jgi:translocation and assembly module TamB
MLRRGLAFTFLALVFLLGLVAILLNTESGTRFVINRIDAFVPGSLYADDVDGTLWRGMRIPVFRYRDDNLDLAISDLDIAINWPNALAGTLSLNTLRAGEVVYRDRSVQEASGNGLEVEMPPVPLRIGIERGRIAILSIDRNEVETTVTDLAVDDVVLVGQRIRFDRFAVNYDEAGVVITDADTTLTAPVPVEAGIEWTFGGEWAGSATLSGSLNRLQVTHELSTPWAIGTDGDLRLLGRTDPEFDLLNQWQRIDIEAASFRDGQVRVSGTMDDYRTAFSVTVDEPRVPTLSIDGRADGSLTGFADTTFSVVTSSGAATAAGSLRWSPEPGASLLVQASDVDPSMIDERLTGLLSATADVSVQGVDAWQVRDARIEGEFLDSELAASGSISGEGDAFSCEQCLVALGGNRALIDGSLEGSTMALELDVDATDLAELSPAMAGSLEIDWSVTGTFELPRFRGIASGRALGYAGVLVSSARLESRDPAGGAFDLTLAADGIVRDTSELGSLNLSAAGEFEDATIDVDWSLPDVATVSATAQLGLAGDTIAGTIRRAAIDGTHSGRWILGAPAGFAAAPDSVKVDGHRWLLPSGELLVSEVEIGADRLSLAAELNGLALSTANSFLPDQFALRGTANAAVDVQRNDAGWLGTIAWTQEDTILTVTPPEEDAVELEISDAGLNARLDGDDARVEARLRLEPGVSLRAEGSLTDLLAEPRVDGTITLDGEYWKWVSLFFPELDDFDGDVSAALAVNGPLDSPDLSGSASWSGGRAIVPELNVALTDVNITATSDRDGTAKVKGFLNAGDGSLALDGTIDDVLLASRRIELDVTGNAAEVLNWPEYRLIVSPEVTVIGEAGGWDARGTVEIPVADIAIVELPASAVDVSPDVRVIDEEFSTEATDARLSGEARVVLGDDVHISAFGLDTHITGELLVGKLPGRDLSGEGRVELIGGRFSAYGQELTIEEGTLTFTGPLDDPIVNVRATRTIEDFDGTVVAGIRLNGRANNLTATIYSDPAMSEADALSYLVMGRPLSEVSVGEGQELSNAAVGLGLRQASRITQQVGQTIGLDQLTIIGDGGDATALVAGKQFNSRLYARYAYGVFSQVGMILIRYRLTERLSLEAGAGETQSIDVLYSVDQM